MEQNDGLVVTFGTDHGADYIVADDDCVGGLGAVTISYLYSDTKKKEEN